MRITFGSKDPSDQSAVGPRWKEDIVYSESNYTVMIDDDHLHDHFVTLRDLIKALNYGKPCECADHRENPEHGPVWVLENEFQSACWNCQQSTKVPCALFQNPQAGLPVDASPEEAAKATEWPAFSMEPLHTCPIIEKLLNMTGTPSERRFYEMYFIFALWHSASPTVLRDAYHPQFSQRLRAAGWKQGVEIGGVAWFSAVYSMALHHLDYPALIPQVILNFVPTRDLQEGHPDKDFYERNPGRVDFFFLDARGKHIVEIDGPYHHKSQQQYTRVLRRIRNMQNRGYHVHRFSNMEVMQAGDFRTFARDIWP